MKTFSDKVYDLLRKVPKGRVTTYKEIALALENRAAYRGGSGHSNILIGQVT